jgi:SPP1 family predicted phage head-tail adaptor
VWAQIYTTGGREFYAAQKLHAETKVVFRVRYDSSIVVTQRIKWLSRYFNILSIDLCGGQYRELLISTSEVE